MIRRIRPQVALALIALAAIALTAIPLGYSEIATGCVVGIASMAKELIDKG